MAFWTGRTVVYETECSKALDRLKKKYNRLDEALAGLEWALSNKPEVFPPLYGSSLRMASIESAPGVPDMRIWFTFTDHKVSVIFAEECEEDGG